MSRRPRRNHSPAFKSKVALAATNGEQTITELAQKFDVRPNQITQWKNQLLEQASKVFEQGGASTEPSVDVKTLHAKIGQLTLENDFFRRSAHQSGIGLLLEPALKDTARPGNFKVFDYNYPFLTFGYLFEGCCSDCLR